MGGLVVVEIDNSFIRVPISRRQLESQLAQMSLNSRSQDEAKDELIRKLQGKHVLVRRTIQCVISC